jgi:hypothetical protein
MNGPAPFQHVVLTVFNVRLHFGGNAPPGEDWLRHRFRLFEELCLPSMRAQRNQQFTWLVLFDAGTPAVYRERIAGYAAWRNFVPCFTDQVMSVETFAAMKKDLVARHIPPADYLITSTLDNDDALHEAYLDTVQRQFEAQPYEFIYITHGFALDYTRRKLYRKDDPTSPFVSLIERMEGWTTVWLASHRELARYGPVRQVETEPLWLQVIHGRNVINSIDLFRRVPLTSLGSGFPRPPGAADSVESPASILLDNMKVRARSMLQLLRR